jgi:hypothetical protein
VSGFDQGQLITLVSLLGCVILLGSGFASYGVNAGKAVRMALVWAAIFCGGFAVVSWFGIA